MNEKLKQKLGYWTESLFMFGGLVAGIAMVLGGFYMLYIVLKAVIGQGWIRQYKGYWI